jgi:hypothetical protein
LEAVLLARWIEVAEGGFKVRRIAVGAGVDMDTVFAHGKVLEIKLEVDTLFAGGEGSGTSVFSRAGFDGDDDGVFRGGCGDWKGEEAKSKGGGDETHRLSPGMFPAT